MLKGIKVIDFTRVLSGPFCTHFLGDLGADVIKIEHPTNLDPTRKYGPPFAEDFSAYYMSINRNKRSLTLDFKKQEDVEFAKHLVKTGDVVVENFVDGNMEKYGLGYETLKEIKPDLIYASVRGFGQDSDRRREPVYDLVIQAQSGIIHTTGAADGPGYKVGSPISDLTAGVFCYASVLGALYHRERTGKGQRIEVPMLDTSVAMTGYYPTAYLACNHPTDRIGNHHQTICPYGMFSCSDGDIVIACGSPRTWNDFADALGLEKKPEWESNDKRVGDRDNLISTINKMLSTWTTAECAEMCKNHAIPYGTVNNITQLFEQHPHLAAGRFLRHPVKYSDTPVTEYRDPPQPGQHNEEILAEYADFVKNLK